MYYTYFYYVLILCINTKHISEQVSGKRARLSLSRSLLRVPMAATSKDVKWEWEDPLMPTVQPATVPDILRLCS